MKKQAETKTETELDKINTKFKNELILGKDKKIHYTNWTGKTKKQFNKIFENIDDAEEIDPKSVTDLLIREYILEKDIYLNPMEEQYVLLKIREVSLTDEFTFLGICPECSTDQEITDSINNIYHFKEGRLPVDFEDYSLVDIPLQSLYTQTVDEIMYADDYDGITSEGDIEVAMHVKIGDKTTKEVLKTFEDWSLIQLNELLKNLGEYSPSLDNGIKKVCVGCKKKVTFQTDDIPNIFEELM